MFPLAIFIGSNGIAKSSLAFQIQSKIPSFIINADSMQVYDKLDILTNKPKKNLLTNIIANYLIFYPIQKNVTLVYGEENQFNC